VQLVRDFFVEIDRRWRLPRRPDKIRLSLIGCGALLLQADYQRGTKDSDVFETTDLREETKTELCALAGKGTDLAVRHSLARVRGIGEVRIDPGVLVRHLAVDPLIAAGAHRCESGRYHEAECDALPDDSHAISRTITFIELAIR